MNHPLPWLEDLDGLDMGGALVTPMPNRSNRPPAMPVVPDTGCPDLGISSCFLCPLRQCRYDDEHSPFEEAQTERDAAVLEAHYNGASSPELQLRFGISDRTVGRAIKRARKAAL